MSANKRIKLASTDVLHFQTSAVEETAEKEEPTELSEEEELPYHEFHSHWGFKGKALFILSHAQVMSMLCGRLVLRAPQH